MLEIALIPLLIGAVAIGVIAVVAASAEQPDGGRDELQCVGEAVPLDPSTEATDSDAGAVPRVGGGPEVRDESAGTGWLIILLLTGVPLVTGPTAGWLLPPWLLALGTAVALLGWLGLFRRRTER